MYKNYANSDTFTALDANSVMRQGIVPVASLTERNRLVAHKGMTIYRTDLNREERYDGTNWTSSESGLIQIYPTSVTGTMQLQADGSVGGTNVINGRCNIDGVFSTRYNRYRIITTMSGKASTNPMVDAIVRTASGQDNGQAEYYLQQSTWTNGTAFNSNATTTSFRTIFDDTGTIQFFTTEVFIGSSFALLNSSFTGRGGAVSHGQKTAGIEGLAARPTGLGIDLGQTVAAPNMRFYAYT